MNKKFGIILGLLLVLSLFAACDNATTKDDANAPAMEEKTTTEENTEAPAMEEKVDESTIDAVLEKALSGKVEYSVVYDYTATTDGETSSGELSMFMKGQNFRTDSKMTIDGKAVEGRVVVTNDKSYTCAKDDGTWSCFELSTKGAEEQEPINSEEPVSAPTIEEDKIGDYSIVKLAKRTVAGTTADCYKLTYKQGVSEYDESFTEEFCHSKEGVPLYVEIKSDSYSTKMAAKSYKTSVSNDDFIPPAEPQNLEEMMKGYNIPSY